MGRKGDEDLEARGRFGGSFGGTAGGGARHPGLDALRGIAILGVLLFHAYIVNVIHGVIWSRTVGQGAEGVGLFFIVSALTLSASWHHRQGRDPKPSAAFWARRFFRIAPLFYLVLAVAWLIGVGKPNFAPHAMAGNVFTLGNLVAHVTFAFGWIPAYQNSWLGVEWSIGTEMAFYLLFPLLILWLVPRMGAIRTVFLGFMLSMAWPWVMAHVFAPWPGWAYAFLFWSLPGQAVWFALGLSLFWTARPGPAIRGLTIWMIGAVALAVALMNVPPAYSAVLWAIPGGLLTYAVWHRLPGVAFITNSRWLQYVGTRSYSWYLLHWPILVAVVLPYMPDATQQGALGFAARFTAMAGLTVAAGELSYRFVEEPARKWGQRLIARWGWSSGARPRPARQREPEFRPELSPRS